MLEEWFQRQHFPAGIGVDLVKVSDLTALGHRVGDAFLSHTFTQHELAEATQASSPWVYFAGRFAVKEAVFKALAHLTEEKQFDFRCVETLTRHDGSPGIVPGRILQEKMEEVGVEALEVSISNEDDYAIAFVMAVKRQERPKE